MSEHRPGVFGRRNFLNRLMATTALVASGPAWAQHSHGTQGAPVRALTTPRTAAGPGIVTPAQGPTLVNPPVIAPASNGNFGLTAQMVRTNLVTGTGSTAVAQPVYLRAFVDSNNLPPANAPIIPPTIAIANNGRSQNVSVVLTNNLPAEPVPGATGAITQAAVPTNPHGFNTINLHTHGLHVSPLQDNVYIELQPAANGPSAACTPTAATPVWACNGSYTYSYNFGQTPGGGTTQIPAGTYWYHPHKHGAVGVQVASGMAGAFIVRGDLDVVHNMPSQQQENVLVVQLIPYTAGATPGAPSVVDPVNFYGINVNAPPASATNLQMSVNGQINPTIAMQYGQIQRWRVVNATAEQFFFLQVAQGNVPFAPPALFAIAVDGVPLTNAPATGIPVPFPLGAPSPTPTNLAQAALNEIAILAPGQRLDLLVKAPPYGINGATFNVNAMQWTAGGAPPIVIPNQTIATIALNGTLRTPATLPTSGFGAGSLYRPPLTGTVPTAPTQVIQFGFINGAAGGVAGSSAPIPPPALPAPRTAPPLTPFTPATSFALPQPPSPAPLPAQLQLKLNAVDLWQVSSDPINGFGPHAFHIHVNSFMITKRYGINLAPALIWRDTVRIEQGPKPTNTVPFPPAPTVEFVSQQVDYTGDFVLHCHVLEHEDSGMMWSVNISK